MKSILIPLYLLVMSFAGYLNREQGKILEYLRTENAVLRQQLIVLKRSAIPRRVNSGGDIVAKPALGGLHHSYRRAA